MAENRKATRWSIVFSLLTFKIIYEIVYINFISPVFAYSGLIYTPDIPKCILSYVVYIILIMLLPRNMSRVSTYLIGIYFVFAIAPIISFYWLRSESTYYMLLCSISFLVLSIIASKQKKAIKIIRLRDIKIDGLLIVACVSVLLLLTIKYGLADMRALHFSNVYEVRSERTYASILKYLINWVPYSFVPCIVGISLYYKKKLPLIFAIGLQGYLYFFTANKTVLFSIVLILASYYISKRRKNIYFVWSFVLIGIQLFSVFANLYLNMIEPISIVPVRLLVIPSQLSFEHFNFFSENQKLFFSESIIGRIFNIQSPYSEFSTFMLGHNGSNANTGYLGDAYDNGGAIVMLLYSLLIGKIIQFVDRISTSSSLPVFVSILTYTMIALLDMPFLVTLMTGGLALNIIILYVFQMQSKGHLD